MNGVGRGVMTSPHLRGEHRQGDHSPNAHKANPNERGNGHWGQQRMIGLNPNLFYPFRKQKSRVASPASSPMRIDFSEPFYRAQLRNEHGGSKYQNVSRCGG
jgi:hypothetical protein